MKLLPILFLLSFACGKINVPVESKNVFKDTIQHAPKIVITQKPIFHIKIVCYGTPEQNNGQQAYCIHFTNDNWKTYHEIVDFQKLDEYYYWCSTALFTRGRQEAIDYAQKFTTYKKCLDWNNAEQEKLKNQSEWVRQNPEPKPTPIKKQACIDCCKEIIIH